MELLVEVRVTVPDGILRTASEVYKEANYSIGAYNAALSELAEQWVLGAEAEEFAEQITDIVGVTALSE